MDFACGEAVTRDAPGEVLCEREGEREGDDPAGVTAYDLADGASQ
jgi:hypothetical protein